MLLVFGGAGLAIGLKCLNEGFLVCAGTTFGSGKFVNSRSALIGAIYLGSCSLLATACKTSFNKMYQISVIIFRFNNSANITCGNCW